MKNPEKKSQDLSYDDVLSNKLLSDAKKASLEFCVFPHNANSPMSDASLARLFYRHIPEYANMVELNKAGDQSKTKSPENAESARLLSLAVTNDIVASRVYSNWLAPHLSDESKALFAQGSKNSLNPALDRLAEIGGFKRDDVLTREKAAESVPEDKKRLHQQAMALANKNLGFGR